MALQKAENRKTTKPTAPEANENPPPYAEEVTQCPMLLKKDLEGQLTGKFN